MPLTRNSGCKGTKKQRDSTHDARRILDGLIIINHEAPTLVVQCVETAGLQAWCILFFELHCIFRDAKTKKEDSPCGVSSL